MKGTIALDIDGTITSDFHSHMMSAKVMQYLSKLASEGWRLIFITGRSFHAGLRILEKLPFNYYLAVQNGAIIFEMPSRKIIGKRYLEDTIFGQMDLICSAHETDYIVYGGYEHDDVCYYRPKRFSPVLIKYINERTKSFQEKYLPLESYDQLPLKSFPAVKSFARLEQGLAITQQIEAELGLHVPLIRDPFDENYYVIQATHPKNSKGQALKDLIAMHGRGEKVIAAGDDLNDSPMLLAADIKIAMPTAPKELLEIADIIAPPSEEDGIIRALDEAIKKW